MVATEGNYNHNRNIRGGSLARVARLLGLEPTDIVSSVTSLSRPALVWGCHQSSPLPSTGDQLSTHACPILLATVPPSTRHHHHPAPAPPHPLKHHHRHRQGSDQPCTHTGLTVTARRPQCAVPPCTPDYHRRRCPTVSSPAARGRGPDRGRLLSDVIQSGMVALHGNLPDRHVWSLSGHWRRTHLTLHRQHVDDHCQFSCPNFIWYIVFLLALFCCTGSSEE